MIHIQIPATSANMGPGFDSIGVAVQLYNHIWVEEQTDGLTIEVRRKQELEVPTDETNLIYQTMKFSCIYRCLQRGSARQLHKEGCCIQRIPCGASGGICNDGKL